MIYDTWIQSDLINSYDSYFGDRYKDTTGKGHSIFTGNNSNDARKILLNEIEVYKAI